MLEVDCLTIESTTEAVRREMLAAAILPANLINELTPDPDAHLREQLWLGRAMEGAPIL